jgi:hypothetical protein
MEANAQAESARARRVEMRSDDPRELDLADVRWNSLKNSATLLNRVEHELETNPERIPDTIRRLDAMLRGGGSDEDEVLGFTKQGLLTKISSQQQRDQLGTRLQRTLQDYYQKAQAKAATIDPADFESFYRANPRSGKNHDWSGPQEAQMVQGYMRAKGLDPYSGATVEHLWQLTGRVADSFYGPLFERARINSPSSSPAWPRSTTPSRG